MDNLIQSSLNKIKQFASSVFQQAAPVVSNFNNTMQNTYKQFAITPQKVQDFTTNAVKYAPPVQFGQSLGKTLMQPFNYINMQSMTNTDLNEANKMTNLAIKLQQQGKAKEAQNLFQKSREYSQRATNQAQQFQTGNNQLKRDVVSSGIKTGLTAIATPAIAASPVATLGVPAIIGGAFNKIQGGSFSEGAGRGMAESLPFTGLQQITSPLINLYGGKIANKIISNPTIKNVMLRVMAGGTNVLENEIMGKIDNKAPDAFSNFLGFSLGAIMHNPNEQIKGWRDLPPTTKQLIIEGGNKLGLDTSPSPYIKDQSNSGIPSFLDKRLGQNLDQMADNLDFGFNVKAKGGNKAILNAEKVNNKNLVKVKGAGNVNIPELTADQIEANKKLPDILFATTKAEAEGKGAVKTKINTDKLPWETPEYLNSLKNKEQVSTTLNPSESAQKLAEANTLAGNNGKGGIGGLANDVKTAFQDWVNSRHATKVEGLLKSREFQGLDATGPEAFQVFQEGYTKGKYGEVKKYFDSKRQQVVDSGIDVRYKQDYLPQLWANTKEEVQKAIGNKLGTKPSFSMESVIKNYQEGIDAGLTPRFNTIGELAGWYEKTANKAIADKGFFDYLAKEGMIMTPGKAPSDWVTLSPDRFPKIKVNMDGKQYSGDYKAPPEIAKLINNYLNPANEGLITNIANYASRVKNIALSFGVPGTGINAHGVNMLARHTLFGAGGNPVSRLMTGIKYMVNPESAARVLEKDLSTAPRAVHAGLTLSAEDHNGILNSAETIAQSLGKKWNNAFEVPLFNKMIPALKLSSFNKLVEGGMTEKDAAIMINNVYGGINWEQMGRDRNTQNLLRALILAPDWAETNLKLGGNIAKSLVTGGKVAAQYRIMGATFLGSYVAANVANKLSSGHYMYQNDPGHTMEIEIGYTPDGQKRYLRPYGTAVDFVRIPYDSAIAIAKGDPSPVFRAISNRLSMPAGAAMHLLTNTDYTGKAIYGRDKYGKDIPVLQAAGGIAGEVGNLIGFPSVLKQAIDTGTGKQGIEQGITQGFELPFRYSGGQFNGTDKNIANALKVSGKERYDLSKTLKEQSPFSSKQQSLIQMGGQNALNDLIQKRAEDKKVADIKKQAEEGDMTPKGNLIPVMTKTGVKVIDTSSEPQKPQLTGNKELDKSLTSKYQSEITSKKNDIIALYQGGKISAQEAEAQLSKLKSLSSSYAKVKKPKKISVKKVTLRKIKMPKSKIVAIKKPKLAKIKFTQPKKVKVQQPKIRMS